MALPLEGRKSLTLGFYLYRHLCSYVKSTSTTPGAAASQAEAHKNKLYAEFSQNYHFIPIAIETSGVWGPIGLKFIHELGRRIKANTGEPRSTFYLIQRISLAIQRGNSASILGAIPKQSALSEVFYLLSDKSCNYHCKDIVNISRSIFSTVPNGASHPDADQGLIPHLLRVSLIPQFSLFFSFFLLFNLLAINSQLYPLILIIHSNGSLNHS